jgi:hypothetical protein
VSFGVRPEHVRVERAPVVAENVVAARVAGVAAAGPFLKLRLEGALPLTAYVSAEAFAADPLAVAAEVHAAFDAEAVVVIP